MKTILYALLTVLGLALAADADAARRFGGGSNIGKQRATPAQREATPPPAQSPAATPAPAPAAPATPAAPAPRPSFMSRWGGVLAGLGIGALLASMFGAQMGPIVGMILMVLAIAAIGLLLMRLFASRAQPAPAGAAPKFSGIGSRAGDNPPTPAGTGRVEAPVAAAPKPTFETEPFLRVAKTSFIRLQAANDAGDLDDIRDYTTPEVYAEIAMQIKERGGAAQRTEVVNLNAELVETALEGDYEIASVRFYGLIREDGAANPEPFDETWHVRKDVRDRRGAWLISGIQQAA